jgi:hypothetical protein
MIRQHETTHMQRSPFGVATLETYRSIGLPEWRPNPVLAADGLL